MFVGRTCSATWWRVGRSSGDRLWLHRGSFGRGSRGFFDSWTRVGIFLRARLFACRRLCLDAAEFGVAIPLVGLHTHFLNLAV